MTTEQQDWLDDERAGRHPKPDVPTMRLDEFDPPLTAKQAVQVQEFIVAGLLAREHVAFTEWNVGPYRLDPDQPAPDLDPEQHFGHEDDPWIDKKPEPGEEPYWVERVTDAEEHTHYTRDARDQCAAGDHRYAVLLDNAAKREKIAAHEAEVTTMAEEPIENRLRRAWLNGFRDGVDRASYAATESTGRWDY